MLSNAPYSATIPVTNLERARAFYSGTLGLPVIMERDTGMIAFQAGGGMMLVVYQRPTATSGEHTVVAFGVDDVEQAVDDLTANGVVFEHYNMPEFNLVTDERGIADLDGMKSAWFKDPDGNVLAIGDMPE